MGRCIFNSLTQSKSNTKTIMNTLDDKCVQVK